MKRYNVGPKYTLSYGDTIAVDMDGVKCQFVDAETPAKARATYALKTGYKGKTKAEFIKRCQLEVIMKKKYGGPAFPYPKESAARAGSGMTLRDYFAGQALASDSCPANRHEFVDTTRWCYRMADAMLAERGKE